MDAKFIESIDLSTIAGMKCKTADGAELYFETYGNGPNLTIINNYFVISPLWRNFTKQLVRRNQIITYDLRNQGASTRVSGNMSIATHIDDLVALLDGLSVEKTYLLGTSISTLIARDFALAHPDRIKGLILVGPVFAPYGSRRRKLLTRSWLNSLENGGMDALFAHIFPLVYTDQTVQHGGPTAFLALRERFKAVNDADALKANLTASLTTEDDPLKLKQINAPTLLMTGDGDFLMSPTSLRVVATLIPDCEIRVIDYAGHVPYFEAGEAFEGLIQDFIDRNEAGQRKLAS
jgi:3-oxoadipate enol-lactonase